MFVVLMIILGLIFGCLANVYIYTMPRDIPIFDTNYYCYRFYTKWPLVICINILLFLLMYFFINNIYVLPIYLFLVFSLLIVTVIDLQFKIVPDQISIILIIVGLSTSFANSYLDSIVYKRVIESFLGFCVGGGSLLLIGLIGKFFFDQDIMGGGDIKLMAAIGTFIGWQKVLLAIFLASLIGSIIGIILIIFKKRSKHEAIAFVPYISLGSVLTFVLPTPSMLLNFVFMLEDKFLTNYIIG